MITDDKLAELEAAEKAATPGPWAKGYSDGSGPEYITCNGKAVATTNWLDIRDEPSPQESANVEFIALARNHMRELIESARKLNVIDAIAHDPKYGSDPMWVLINVRGVLGLSTGITQMPGLTLQEENEKLRAELRAARDEMSRFTKYCIPGCPCVFHAAIKRIDDSGLLKEDK